MPTNQSASKSGKNDGEHDVVFIRILVIIIIIIILFKSGNMAHEHKQETYRQTDSISKRKKKSSTVQDV